MPFHQSTSKPRYPALVAALAKELRSPHHAASSRIPDIQEQQVRHTNNLHVRVIWNRWVKVPKTERGAVILDAYEKAFDRARASRVTLTMALTPDEARRLGMTSGAAGSGGI